MDDISVFDIKPSNLRDHINKFVYNHGVEKEFSYIEKKTEKDILHGDFKTALKDENKLKNRYSNVLPPEQYRVPLVLEPDDHDSDYINASYINDPAGKQRYICTQGPLENTFNDFWRMVWECKSNVIVMLTREEENSKKKCDRYWVDQDSHDYGHIRLIYETHIALQDMIQRIFTLVNLKTNEKRKLVHFQYISWPDHGTPVSIKGFLNLIQAVEKEDKTGPIIVHCSAGIGRSGTFCVIHSVVTNYKNELKNEQYTLNIPKIITNFRTQRPGMVQTKEQYRFCYSAIAEGTSMEQLRKGRKERSLSYSIN
ncbi:protein tyrosine phosphatase [Cavenderia fasciculata]|uniref:protein-tyrosine-phosphatase n=1 Tax=Cavenderia fasciculata TaxID=261658 RepID=F4PU34_CACFS|nr:protein tyrosine phosphatase [Cavenderia fasciculata]EGG20960.1 protein tyrosine phosphatase [Cavenderia fasciculata]|eukprot:XP_004358810.1 protein tyrosine phosphatase [Cavenderia fasciculata]